MKTLTCAGLSLLATVQLLRGEVNTNTWPNDILDFLDYPCEYDQDGFEGMDDCTLCSSESAFAMTRWRISEPYLTLWLHDVPLAYSPSQGPDIALRLTYKQRSSGVDRGFSSVGTNWGCQLFAYFMDDGTNLTYCAEGAQIPFQLYTKPSYKIGTAVAEIPGFYGGGTYYRAGFKVWHADGSYEQYTQRLTRGPVPICYLLRFAYDRHGFVTEYRYGDSGQEWVVRQIIDSDGKTNFLNYAHSLTNLLTSMQDPYGRVAQLQYDTAGHLTNIVDVASNSSAVVYDASGLVTNLTTPYGTTSFRITQTAPFQDPINTNRWVALGGTNVINRLIEITEANGSKQLYCYRDDARKLNASSTVDLLPATLPRPDTGSLSNSFESNDLFYRNSFHWNRQQYAALTAAGRADYGNLSTNDYQLARLKHWLGGTGTNGPVVTDALALRREPSPDGYTSGQVMWHDYAGQNNSHTAGTNGAAQLTARLLPDGSSWCTRQEVDAYENPTNLIATYSGGGAVRYRTNDLKYSLGVADNLTEATVREGANSTLLLRAYYTLNGGNQLLYFTNAVGEITTNKYDTLEPMSRLLGTMRPSGLNTTNFYYSSGDYAGWVQQIVDYAGTYTSGASSNRVRSFTYTNGLLYTYTDPRGLTVTATWDALQRLTSLAFPDGTYFSNRFDKLDLVAHKDRLGNWRYFSYNSLRQLTSVSDELGRTNWFGYCDCGALYSITNALGQVTFFDHDYAGRLTSVSATNGTLATYQYNSLGQITNVLDGAGKSVKFSYNNQGLLTAVSNAYGRVLSAIYDHRDRATNVVTATGVTLTNLFDNLDRLLARGWPDGGVEHFGYSARGLVGYTNQLSHWTRLDRDEFRRVTYVSRAGVQGMLLTYNPAGDVLKLITGVGLKTYWAYDVFGLPLAKTNNDGALVWTNAYDANWRLTARWTPAKGLTAYGYDAVGSLTNIAYPISPSVALAYDALNRLTNLVTAGLFTNNFAYTNFGALHSALASEDGPWSDDTVSYSYGNLQRTALALSTPTTTLNQTYGYDAAWRLTNVTAAAGTFRYSYRPDASALIAQLLLPGGSLITNTFDGLGRLASTSLKTSGGLVRNAHNYGYNLAGQRLTVTNNTGNYALFGYDNIGQLTAALAYETNGTPRLNEQLGYGYDAAGNLWLRTNNALVQTFSVNGLNQLTAISRDGSFTVSGNTSQPATNVTVNGLAATRYADTTFAKDGFTLTNGNNSYTVQAQMAIGLSATNTLTVNLPITTWLAYDANGNLRTNGAAIYDYDDADRLVTNWVAGAWKSEFVYDGLSRRRITRDYGWQGGAWVKTNEVRYVDDGPLVLQERDSNNVPRVTYTRGVDLSSTLSGAGGIGGLLARTDVKGSVFYHADGSGNVTALVDKQQTLEARYLYDPYGNMLGMWGPLAERNMYRFSSKQVLPSGLYDYGFRFYEPNLSRWINPDPIGEVGGINLFRFAANNPVSFADPNGLQLVETGVGIAVTTTTTSTGAGAATVVTVSGAGAAAGGLTSATLGGLASGAMPVLLWWQWQQSFPAPTLYPDPDLTGIHNPIPSSAQSPLPTGTTLGPGEYRDQEGNIRDAKGDIVKDKNGRSVKGEKNCPPKPTRNLGKKQEFLKQLADDPNTPTWMKPWLENGLNPPGYDVDHTIPLSIGGADEPSNMRLVLRMDHWLHHKYYRPWE